ncbi:MAG: diguanylate cyclase [Alphaproteobacteria bacterium]|nr:diguanylate cyclase [Alphaproteobacteria bacterium]
MREIALRYPDIAMLMITGEGNEKIAAEAFRNGAQDYVVKSSLTGDTLAAAINNGLSRKAEEVEILRRANHDELTGLGNRRLFNDRLDHILDHTDSLTACAVIFFDLNGFKLVNDTHGHGVGDALLKEVAERAKKILRPGDTLARLGGDEFVILLENLPGDGAKMAQSIASRLTGEIRDRAYHIKGSDITIGASVGLALYPRMADNRHDLLRIADQAMYAMKRKDAQAREKNKRAANG